jgi:hypothetical protein
VSIVSASFSATSTTLHLLISSPDSSPVARVVWWEWVRFLSDWEILYSRWRPYIMADAISKEW